MKRSVFDLKVGEHGIVQSFAEKELESQFLALGLLPKSKVLLKRKAPFGGSLYIIFNEVSLAIRRSEASKILIE